MALGAVVLTNGNGIITVEPAFERSEELLEINDISEQPPVREALELVRRNSLKRDVLLSVQAPYSVLASVTDQLRLYSWLKRCPDRIRTALRMITKGLAGYVREAFSHGARIVSIADPYARPEVIGFSRYREYAALCQYRLLQLLENKRGGIVHLCPHCSIRLEEYGYITVHDETFGARPYHDALLDSAGEGMVFVGHQCVHTRVTGHLYKIVLNKSADKEDHFP
jgi:uroporphyrinogen-III decarboxylase